jgi:hypothetical protein
MSEELKPTDDQCDRLVSLTMEKLAAKGCDQYGDMTWTDLNPNIVEHHALRRSIVRVAYGAGEAEVIAAWNRRAQPEPAAPDEPASAEPAPGWCKYCRQYTIAEPLDAAPSVAPEPPTREVLAEIVRSHLTSTYHCTRVWAAWNIGTMTEDDFEPASESDMAEDVADAILAAHPPRAPLTDAEAKRLWVQIAQNTTLDKLIPEFARAVIAAIGATK